MMDDETRWQNATLPADSQLIGPPKPDDAGDCDDLETGIASIFAAMQAEADGAAADDEDGDDESPEEDAHTFQLLSELDRLWQRPSP